jgi:anti-anti-sigma factor
MSNQTSEALDFTMVRVLGTMDFETAAKLRAEFSALETGVDGDIALDLSQVPYMDATGLSAVMTLYRRLTLQSRRLVICGACGQVADYIARLRLDSLIPCLAADTGRLN